MERASAHDWNDEQADYREHHSPRIANDDLTVVNLKRAPYGAAQKLLRQEQEQHRPDCQADQRTKRSPHGVTPLPDVALRATEPTLASAAIRSESFTSLSPVAIVRARADRESYFRRAPRATLFLDDVAALHRILSTRCRTVTIELQGATAETVEDLQDASRADLQTLSLSGDDPEIVLDFQYGMAHTFDDSDSSRQTVVEVCDYIDGRKRDRKRFLFPVLVVLIAALMWMAMSGSVTTTNNQAQRSPLTAAGFVVGGLVLGLGLGLVLGWIERKWWGRAEIRVIPMFRRDHRKGLIQNRTAWISSILTLFLGALIGHYWQ